MMRNFLGNARGPIIDYSIHTLRVKRCMQMICHAPNERIAIRIILKGMPDPNPRVIIIVILNLSEFIDIIIGRT